MDGSPTPEPYRAIATKVNVRVTREKNYRYLRYCLAIPGDSLEVRLGFENPQVRFGCGRLKPSRLSQGSSARYRTNPQTKSPQMTR